MAISRADLLKELLPGLNELFGMEYAKYNKQRYAEARRAFGGASVLHGATRPVDAKHSKSDESDVGADK
jgi:hypothetical protein